MGMVLRQACREAEEMIAVRNLRLLPGEEHDILPGKAASKLRISESSILSYKLLRKSLDARKKSDIYYNITAAFELSCPEGKILSRSKSADVFPYNPPEELSFSSGLCSFALRPVVVGFGPAGIFASLALARAGLKPIVIERGQEAAKRKAAVDAFRLSGILNPESNAQFGEGGAGTFSDGKLNTNTHDGRISFVLSEFHKHGAPESILYDAKPHIGTDILINVVQSFRQEIISLGGEVRFETKLVSLDIKNGSLRGAVVSSGGVTESIPCDGLILAIGHSARDTFENLLSLNIPMERKAFSMGARIEHLQRDISFAQYGEKYTLLPPADYSLSVHLPDGNSAYTFCMCPGGYVFAAASEINSLCTNGMSYSRRDSENANSALLVSLKPEEFPGSGVLAGMHWQRDIERRAFECGGGNYYAPAQLLGDFLANKQSTGAGKVTPSYMPGVSWCNLRDVLPEKICTVFEKAIPLLDNKLHGFNDAEAVITAPETRSSSPVRIIRDESCQSAVRGLFPCGEGAGYAGGITSAAVDGIRCAQALLNAANLAE